MTESLYHGYAMTQQSAQVNDKLKTDVQSVDLRMDPGLGNQIPSALMHDMFHIEMYWLQLPHGRIFCPSFSSHSFPPPILTIVLFEFRVI
jgi:hypothetical protein